MSSLDQRRSRPRVPAALTLASTLLLAASAPVSLAAAQTEAGGQRQKLEQLRDVNADAERNADELRSQMNELEAEAIDRGLLLMLDDAVFTTNNVGLSPSGERRLNALAAFLKQHPKRSVAIDGYAGAADFRFDQALSKRRADAVKAYLIQQDIAPSRLTARPSGAALQDPDGSATEQQTLRRVEVIIEDPMLSAAGPSATAPKR